MSEIPADLRYASSHEWIRCDGGTAVVGITDHAQHELTDVVYVELPKVGRRAEKGGPVAVIESVKAASDIYAPVGGEILEINPAVTADPSLVNRSPYGEGWLFKIRPDDKSELESLLSASAYGAQIGQ
ncbi:MAG: glycine cleavage system protein GcvH [Verrucomicrobiae bacterium]|nr:glycine cleavage system protein GcvH [Verrucomicrobiae bacterium]